MCAYSQTHIHRYTYTHAHKYPGALVLVFNAEGMQNSSIHFHAAPAPKSATQIPSELQGYGGNCPLVPTTPAPFQVCMYMCMCVHVCMFACMYYSVCLYMCVYVFARVYVCHSM